MLSLVFYSMMYCPSSALCPSWTGDQRNIISVLYRDAERQAIASLEEAKGTLTDSLSDRFAGVTVALPLPPEFCFRVDEDNGFRVIPSPSIFANHDGPCIAYGIGIAHSMKLEMQLVAKGCQVFAFDCTVADVEKMTGTARQNGVHFFPWCVGHSKDLFKVKTVYTKDHVPGRSYEVLRLAEIMQRLGHKSLSLLKFDIEGHEWALFEEEIYHLVPVLLPRILLFELHTEGANPYYVSPAVVKNRKTHAVIDLFLRLSKMGYRVTSKILNPGDGHSSDFSLVTTPLHRE